MKKYFALLALLLAVFIVSCGDDDDPVNNDDVMLLSKSSDTVAATFTVDYAEASVDIENTSDKAVTLTVTTDLSGLAAGHSLSLCIDGNCEEYKTQGFTSDNKITLAAGAKTTIDDFQAKINAMTTADGTPVAGEGKIVFTFAVDGGTETAEYTVNYKIEEPLLTLVQADTEVQGSLSEYYELTSYATITHTSFMPLEIVVKMEFISREIGHSGTICTELCYTPQIDDFTAPANMILQPGQNSKEYGYSAYAYSTNGTEYPDPTPGEDIIKYTFTVLGSPHQTVTYTCKYTFTN